MQVERGAFLRVLGRGCRDKIINEGYTLRRGAVPRKKRAPSDVRWLLLQAGMRRGDAGDFRHLLNNIRGKTHAACPGGRVRQEGVPAWQGGACMLGSMMGVHSGCLCPAVCQV